MSYLSNLLQQIQGAAAARPAYSNPSTGINGGLSGLLQSSINKSSPSFKATQPVVPSQQTTQQIMPQEQPAPIDFSSAESQPGQGFDYFSNVAQNSTDPRARQAATNWIMRNIAPDQIVQDTEYKDSYTEPTQTSGVAYSMEKLNELYSTKSPEDLWALRQQLRRDESSARAGMLPEEQYMQFSGDGVTDGAPRYNYADRTAVNRATADIFGTQIASLDKFMSDYSKGQGSISSSSISSIGGVGSFAGTDGSALIRLATQGLTGTKDERAAIQRDLANALASGNKAGFLDSLKQVGYLKLGTANKEQLAIIL